MKTLAGAADAVLERRELLDADGAARMHLAGGDADLRAHAEFAAIGKLGRGIVEQDRGVDLVEEAGHGGGVLRDDRLGMMRRIFVDMGDGAADTVDHGH